MRGKTYNDEMRGTPYFCCAGAAFALSAPPVYACSGPGAVEAMVQNTGIASIAAIVLCGLLAVMLPLRLRHFRSSARALWPLALLLPHPLWTLRGGGADCYETMRFASIVVAIVGGLLLGLSLFHELRRSGPPERSLVPTGPAISGALVIFAVGLYLLPWTINPLPVQERYYRYSFAGSIWSAQTQRHRELGVYAPSVRVLIEEEYLDGSADRYTRPVDRERAHFMRLLPGRTVPGAEVPGILDWALIARPVEFPEGMELVQYLRLADGRRFTKPDPGDGSFLLDTIPADPEADGWQSSGRSSFD